MLELPIVVVRAFMLALRGHRELILENLAAATTRGPSPNDAMPPAGARPTLLDGSRAKLAKLARGVDCRATRHRRPLASRLASLPLDAPLATATSWPPAN